MRFCVGISVLLASLTWVLSSPVSATETFVCDDGRTLQVTNANREKLALDPCIQKWFASSRTAAEKTGDTSPLAGVRDDGKQLNGKTVARDRAAPAPARRPTVIEHGGARIIIRQR